MKKSSNEVATITGPEIREAREALGLAQQQLADLFGVTFNTLSRWEIGASPPSAPGAIRMALEYLKIQRVLDNSELLRTVDQRRAELDALSEQLERERVEFEQSLKKNRSKFRPGPGFRPNLP